MIASFGRNFDGPRLILALVLSIYQFRRELLTLDANRASTVGSMTVLCTTRDLHLSTEDFDGLSLLVSVRFFFPILKYSIGVSEPKFVARVHGPL